MHGRPAVIKLLVEHQPREEAERVDVNSSVGNSHPMTALHWAAQFLQVEAVHALLELGADPSLKCGLGDS
eukprot:725164-Prymnesium_polylepis.1